MKKALKIAGIALLSIIILLAAAFSIYWYRNIHWYDKYERALRTAEAREKQITLPKFNRSIKKKEVHFMK